MQQGGAMAGMPGQSAPMSEAATSLCGRGGKNALAYDASDPDVTCVRGMIAVIGGDRDGQSAAAVQEG